MLYLMSTKTQVITWATSTGHKLNITPDAETAFNAARMWPKALDGQSYCSVYQGLGPGNADITADIAKAMIAEGTEHLQDVLWMFPTHYT